MYVNQFCCNTQPLQIVPHCSSGKTKRFKKSSKHPPSNVTNVPPITFTIVYIMGSVRGVVAHSDLSGGQKCGTRRFHFRTCHISLCVWRLGVMYHFILLKCFDDHDTLEIRRVIFTKLFFIC